MWINYDDGHAGGYPHDCPDTEFCKFCGRFIKRIHPDAPFELQWSHISREAAMNCTESRRPGVWPVPAV